MVHGLVTRLTIEEDSACVKQLKTQVSSARSVEIPLLATPLDPRFHKLATSVLESTQSVEVQP